MSVLALHEQKKQVNSLPLPATWLKSTSPSALNLAVVLTLGNELWGQLQPQFLQYSLVISIWSISQHLSSAWINRKYLLTWGFHLMVCGDHQEQSSHRHEAWKRDTFPHAEDIPSHWDFGFCFSGYRETKPESIIKDLIFMSHPMFYCYISHYV